MGKILLVEDDNNLREIYEARLQAEGYTIVTAKDGEEALVLAKNEKPDLVISDVMMPKISGFEMLDILRNTEGLKDVKVIMLTALGQSDDQQRANRLGADHYLVKSQVTLEDIVKVTHDLLQDTDPVALAGAPSPAVSTTTSSPALPPMPQVVTPTGVVAPPVPDPVVPAPAAATPVVPVAEPPAPVATPVVEPAVAPAAPADASPAQSSAQESTSVEARIEDFVNGASSDAASPAPAVPPAEEATPAPAPDPTPVAPVPSPDPAVAVPVSAPTVSAAANDDKVITDAVNSLATGTPGTSDATPTPEPVPAPAPAITSASGPADPAPAPLPASPIPASNNTVTIANKKIISPITSEAPKTDLSALLAAEEAKEAAAAPPTPTPAPEATAADPSAGAPTAPPTAPTPEPTPTPTTAGGLDPNSIAL